MKPVIVLSHFFPFPSNVGAEKRVSFVVKTLSSLTEVVLIAQGSGLSDVEEAKKYCAEVVLIKDKSKGILSRILNRLKEPFTLFPASGRHLNISEFREKLYLLPPKYESAVLWIEAIWLMEVFKKDEKRKIVLDQHNMDSFVIKKRSFNKSFPINCLLFLDYLKQKKFEKKYLKKAEQIFVVSVDDREKHENIYCLKNIKVIPNVIDVEKYPLLLPNTKSRTLVMTGDFGYEPNVEGLQYFIKNVLPQIKENIEDIKVMVAGRGSKNLKVKSSDIVLYGDFIKPDEVYKEAFLSIAPILTGGGSRYKIIESLAFGIPVVSTEQGAEGLDLKEKDGLFIAANPNDYAKKIVDIFKNSELSKKAGINGRKCVEEKFSSRAVIENFKKEIVGVLN